MSERERPRVIIDELQVRLETFEAGLEPDWREEFEGLGSVLRDYILGDLRDRNVNHALMGMVIEGISQEVNRVVHLGLPITQEFCAHVARDFEELGWAFERDTSQSFDVRNRDAALVSYEMAVVWYRVVKATYTGVLPVQAQLRVVQNLIRLGTLSRSRETFRRAIRELFFLIDEDKFILLMTQEQSVRVTEAERESLLDYRRKMRASIRRSMIEAVTRLHESVPPRIRDEYRRLEAQIEAREKGPADLLRFLSTVTVIPELKSVEGGKDWIVRGPRPGTYMNMFEHVQQVERALEALEHRDHEYFYSRLRPEDRGKIPPAEFGAFFAEVFEDYHAFADRQGVSKINFWLALLVHDMGRILLESHHQGGALLVQSLLESLGIHGFRQESVLSYVRYHGEWKRFYLLESSPREVVEYVAQVGRANIPHMLLEKRRVESIVDLAATGEGQLTLDFLDESRKYKRLEYLIRMMRDFVDLRLSGWGLESDRARRAEPVPPEEWHAFLRPYFDRMRIAHYHNLPKVLGPSELLKFHYICARVCGFPGFDISEVKLNSDKLEHLQALSRLLQGISLADVRSALHGVSEALDSGPVPSRADFVTRELLRRLGLLLEFKSEGTVLSMNSVYAFEALQASPRRP